MILIIQLFQRCFLVAYFLLLSLAIMLIIFSKQAFAEQAPVYDIDATAVSADDLWESESDATKPKQPSVAVSGRSQYSFLRRNNDDETPLIVNEDNLDIQKKIAHLTQQVNNIHVDDLLGQIDTLRNEIQALRGQVEELSHQVIQLREQQRSTYADLDKRVTSLGLQSAPFSKMHGYGTTSRPNDESAPYDEIGANAIQTKRVVEDHDDRHGLESASPISVQNDQPNILEEQKIYQTAYNLIKNKKYNEAAKSLQEMLAKYPKGQFASNAHYWLGELYGLLGQHDRALIEFNIVVRDYPGSPRISDAFLKKGLIYAAQSKWIDAKAVFKKVINRYPGTTAARIASEQLKQIDQ